MPREKLTREAVEAMPAGVEMDALVAEMVMGWTDAKAEFLRGVGCPGADVLLGTSPGGDRRLPVPDYSQDMGAAWDVARGLLEGDGVRLMSLNYTCDGVWAFNAVTRLGHAFADGCATPALAICRAALLAVVSKEPADAK